MRIFVIFLMLFVASSALAERINLPKDADGWTVFTPSDDTRIVYVSSSSGDDATCTYYNKTQVGADPFNPTNNPVTCATIARAIELTRDGYPDWILLRKGEVHRQNIVIGQLHHGRSETEPFLLSGYGPENEYPSWRPVNYETDPYKIGTPDETSSNYFFRIEGDGQQIDFLALKDIEFYADYFDPSSPNWFGSDGIEPEGINEHTMVGKLGTFRIYGGIKDGVLIEGCKFKQVYWNIQQATIFANRYWTFRRNYFGPKNSSAGALLGVINNALIEENIFYHNGWYNNDFPGWDSGNTYRNHAIYMTLTGDSVLKNNVIVRPCSVAMKLPGSQGDPNETVDGLLVEGNLVVDANIGFGLASNHGEIEYRLKNTTVTDNTFLHMGITNSSQQDNVWFFSFDGADGLTISDNLFAHSYPWGNTQPIGNSPGTGVSSGWNQEPYMSRNVDIENNILYIEHDMEFSYGVFNIKGWIDWNNISIKNNKFISGSTSSQHFFKYFTYNGYQQHDETGTIWSGNTYYSPHGFDFNWKNNGALTESQWKAQYDLTASFDEPSFPDPSRDIPSYMQHIGEGSTLEDFYSKIQTINRFNWDTRFTAPVINEWIRAGYFGATPQPGGSGRHGAFPSIH